jgi:hypothetical protein
MLGHFECAAGVDQRSFGHHPVRRQRARVHPATVLETRHPVDPGDGREPDLAAGVVISRHQAAGQVGQRGRFDGDDHGAFARRRFGKVRVHRRAAQGFDDSCLHQHS